MKLNPYGLVGILFIAGMAGSVAYHWNQHDSWNVFVFASFSLVFYCFGLLLYFNSIKNIKFSIGCHLALIFLIIGTWLPPTYNDTILFPDQYTGKGPSESTLFLITYFFVCWLVGMGCSFLLFHPYNMAGNQVNVVKEDNHLDGRRVGLVVGGIVLVLSAFYLFFLEGTFGACFALFAGGGGFVCIGQGLFANFR